MPASIPSAARCLLPALLLAAAGCATAPAVPSSATAKAAAVPAPPASASVPASAPKAPPVPSVATEPPCTLVVGHGRNLALDDHDANTAWNQLNNLFNAQVAGQLQRAGQRVLRLPLPVEARDLPANARLMLDRAQEAGCDRLLETTIFADDAANLLVVRLRAHPLLKVRNMSAEGALLMIGDPIYTNQRDMQLNLRNLDSLAPVELARTMAADFMRQHPH